MTNGKSSIKEINKGHEKIGVMPWAVAYTMVHAFYVKALD